MNISILQKIKKNITIFLLFFQLFIACGCGDFGNGNNSGSETVIPIERWEYEYPAYNKWKKEKILEISGGGLLIPHLKAAYDIYNRLHITYFESSDQIYYKLKYKLIDMSSLLVLSQDQISDIITIDNCNDLCFSLDSNANPIVTYQGGTIRECGDEKQSDVMINALENENWNEYTAAIGFVERNPVIKDGLAGHSFSMAIDSQDIIHISYQFFYEGCDSMNFQYPDLNYVAIENKIDYDDSTVEKIEANNYDDGNIQNNVGYHNKILIDNNDNPYVFYYAVLENNTRGLRFASKTTGNWELSWIETGCEIGHIDAAFCYKDNSIGVTYYVTNELSTNKTNFLKLAIWKNDSWDIIIIDDSSKCGNYSSINFDSNSNIWIAYYEQKSHSGYDLNNLKIAIQESDSWNKYVISSGEIGMYNYLFFDNSLKPFICSYSEPEKTYYLLSQ